MNELNRRQFLAGSGALLVACCIPARAGAAVKAGGQAAVLNAWIRIGSDGWATLFATHPEIGQGVKTALPMILAEELDMPWERVRVEQAPVNGAIFGRQVAGGSTSVQMAWAPLRKAGATARALLVAAAAKTWSTDAAGLSTRAGRVMNDATGASLSYGDLAALAATLPVPEHAPLKNPAAFRLLGSRIGGVDNRSIVTGKPLFGIDQTVPGMMYATYTKAPANGGTIQSANLDQVRALPGVRDAFILKARGAPSALREGVAVIADSTWSALKAKRALEIQWDLSAASVDDWKVLRETSMEIARTPGGEILHDDGNVDAAFSAAKQVVRGTYVYPFLAHASLEPQNCTAWVRGGGAEIWAPSQLPAIGAKLAAETCGLDLQKVVMHQTRVGGAFGRRLVNDYVVEAVAISQRAGVPVKLQWTREDDFANDFYRPGGVHGLAAALDADGRLSGWNNHFVTVSNDGKAADCWAALDSGLMPQHLVANFRVRQTLRKISIPTGAWRAPGSNALAFVANCFLHEVSTAAARDHLEFLLELMGAPRQLPGANGDVGMHTGRASAVIAEVGRRANWGKKLPAGRAQGLAFYYSHSGYFAEITEVEVLTERRIKVHSVHVVGDVGPIVNLSMAEHQVVGSVTDGLSAMLGQQATFTRGTINETNFHNYQVLRMPHAPPVDVYFIRSNNPPTGLGEPALPPVAPAICNAIFSASAQRIRELPLSLSGYSV